MERSVLPGKLRHRRQGGDNHGAEAIAMRWSMSESAIRCVIVSNMEASHRRVAASVENIEASHRQVAAPVANMRQRACHGSALVVKAQEVWLSSRPTMTTTIGVTRWHWWLSACCIDDVNNQWLQERNKLTRLGR
ncbi:hypothetical protein VPH35_001465 [Triticum aestivum]